MKKLVSLAALAVSLGWAAGAQAQEAGKSLPGGEPPPPSAENTAGGHVHDGFYMRFGLNLGPTMVKLKPDGGGPETSLSGLGYGFDLMFGGTPVDGLAIGGALISGQTSNPTAEAGGQERELDGTMLLAGIAFFADYYFDPSEGLHAQALLGFAAVDFVDSQGGSGGNDPTGAMLGLGVGYDFWIGEEWSVGPLARVVYAPTSADGYKAPYLWPTLGVGITLH